MGEAFSASDLLVGLFIHIILKLPGVPEKLCLVSMGAWLFNLFTFTIGTRGNCEPVVCAIILWIIICVINGGRCYKWHSGTGLLSTSESIQLSMHFHPIVLVLYPRKHASGAKPSLQNWILNQYKFDQSSSGKRPFHAYTPWIFLKSLLTRERILFGFFSASWFFFWTELSFYFYGWEFLHEALLYHLTRTDPRHNFSIYFYHIYLHHEHEFSVMEKLASFLPQLLVQLVLIFCFAFDLPFCLFLQTVAFVAFNKVITAQYFVWFFCLLPLILPWSNMNLRWEGLCCIFMWIAAQGHWLMWGYLLDLARMSFFSCGLQVYCSWL